MSKYFSIKFHREAFGVRAKSKPSQSVDPGLGVCCEPREGIDAYASGVSADASASKLSVYPRHPSVFFDPPLDLVSLDMPALLASTAKFAPLNTGDLSDSDDGSIQNSPVVDSGAFMTGPMTGSMPPETSSWAEDLESSRVSSVPSSLSTNKLMEESPLSSTEALQTTTSLQFSGPTKSYSTFMRRSIIEEDTSATDLPKLGGSRSRKGVTPKLRALNGEDDDILPFETTKHMASRGVRRGSSDMLPSISPSITMTMDRYQNYRKSLSSLEMLQREDSFAQATKKKTGPNDESDGESDGEGDGLIASDEKERKREQARRRQQQDAQLSVYRQQMTKVIGNGRPGIPASASSITLDNTTTFDTLEDDEDDLDDVPLAALRSLTMPQRRGMSRARSSMSIATDLGAGDTSALAPSSSSMLGGLRGGHARQKSVDELPPLPRVFNTEEKRVSRGLVAAISKEEDAKARRKSMPALAPGGIGSTQPDMAIADIQMQIQQLAEMQFQLFNQVNGNGAPQPQQPQVMPSQRRASTIFGNGMAPHSARPASLRSFNGAPAAYTFGQRQSLDLGRAPYSPQSFSSNERLESTAYMPQTPPSGQLSPLPEGRVQNRPSMMRIVTSQDDDDDDDDDEAWQKMLQERRALRAEWARTSS